MQGCNPGAPLIRLNSDFLPNQSEVVLTAGSTFSFGCHGNVSLRWTTTAFRLQVLDRLPNPVEVRSSNPRHTGTYRCGYKNQSLDHLHTWVHLYVKDAADPSSVFVVPRNLPPIREGEDFLFRCMLTDPSVTNLTLQSSDSSEGRGWGLPPGMSVTFDPHRGALIRDLKTSFKGHYVCSGWRDGHEIRSSAVHLLVERRLRHPPSLSISEDEGVRLEGEKYDITCVTSNPSHFYNLTWTQPYTKKLNVSVSRLYSNQRMYINSTVTVSAVSQRHSGDYTCTAVNEAGVAKATTRLTVLKGKVLTKRVKLWSEDAGPEVQGWLDCTVWEEFITSSKDLDELTNVVSPGSRTV
ncbi:macrophage colony-stimulating factor 1 receptor 2-like [Etheostoma cragini]|uniref:macrophage colony-stimulating factor 1 receptor 2-like n=1 Tax=Etheostoma cragini TaxID=417921 RepID=UPI00155E029A|nr:macrophage colony-stimulating factor 1 receptor 2-like [Etheostoma cragini]